MNECFVCGNRVFNIIYSGSLKKCNSCGFITANMEISEELLKRTYSVSYFLGEEYLDYIRDKHVLQLNFKKRIGIIRKLILNRLPLTNCLEIGCAYGFFGEVLKEHFKTKYFGIDVVPEAIAYGQDHLGLEMKTGDYLEMTGPEILYSDIFMWDVIEHLRYPDRFIQKVFTELAPGGRIYITTGDIGALLPAMQRGNWRMIHPPSHLHYFSLDTLQLLLRKYGFKVIAKKYVPIYRSLRQIFYSLLLLKRRSIIFEKLLDKIPGHWSVSFNTFDIVLVIAEKPYEKLDK